MKINSIYFCLLLTLFSCGKKVETEQTTSSETESSLVKLTSKQEQAAGITFGTTTPKTISETLKLNGKIDVPPQNLVSVSVPLGGYLKSTEMLPGMRVTKGQVLAVIEDQQYIQIQEDYLTNKEQMKYAELEYNRQRELNQNKATSDKIFQQAQTEFRSRKIAVNALAEKLRLIGINPQNLKESSISRSIRIISPISGFVSAVNANIGKYLNPSDVLVELIDPRDIHLNLNVFEKDLSKLTIGQNVIAFTNNQVDAKYACKIILISRNLTANRSAEVHCHFEQYDEKLLPGMYMNAEIEIQNQTNQAVPDDAIIAYAEKNYVFIQNAPHLYAMKEVEIGNSEHGFTEIKTPLGKQKIVFNGAYSLLMQLKNIE
jgi:cobalt-zinc-cadmium efflux system membrane fusion protein